MERPNGDKEPLAERLVFGEGTVLLRATAKTTGGALTIFEEIPPLLDTPLHLHSKEDELFYILEGEHVVQRGETEFRVGPGTRCSCREGCRMPSGASCPGKAACSSSAPQRGSRISFVT
jgi:mannose-6-phosphate isomerase-like protein (cupin superfamily)